MLMVDTANDLVRHWQAREVMKNTPQVLETTSQFRAGLSCCASSLAKKPASLAPSGFNPRRQAGSNVYGLPACALRLPRGDGCALPWRALLALP